MSTFSKIAQGLRLTGVTGATNDMVGNWLKGLGLAGATPDMLFAYLRSTGLTGSLSDMLSAYVFSAVQGKVLIDLSPTSNGFYSLSSSFVASSDHTVELDVYVSSFADRVVLVGNTNGGGTFIRINSATEILFHIATGVSSNVSITAIPTGKLSTIKAVLVGSNIKIFLNGLLAGQGTISDPIPASEYNVIGQKGGVNFFGGIISNVKFKDTVTLSNSLEFKLDQLTANTEVSGGVTATYQNIGTGTSVRNTYVLSNDGTQWVSDLRTIDIAAQA
jgi:hypothetical protein